MKQIGRYRITGELGRGAMGVVYLAQDPTIGRMVAVKSIRLGDLTDEAERARLRDRLFREAQSAGVLSHPNIVTIYDVAEEEGMAYVFMEVVHGPSLDKFLRSGNPPGREMLLGILRQTAAALDYAHRKGIVHRDIKPANVMIDDDGTAKITDFGVAKIVSQQMTQAGILMGTPNYMSPEQVQTSEITGRADQFSLAVVIYEILTGQKPFAADNLPALLFKIAREDAAPAHRFNPSVGEAMELVLRKAMSKAAEERFDTCTSFIDAFETAAKGSDWIPARTNSDPSIGVETVAGTVSSEIAALPQRPTASPSPTLNPGRPNSSALSPSLSMSSSGSSSNPALVSPAASASSASSGGALLGHSTVRTSPLDSSDEFPPRRRWPTFLGFAAVTIVALLVAAYFFLPDPEQPLGPYRPPLPLAPTLVAQLNPPAQAPTISPAPAPEVNTRPPSTEAAPPAAPQASTAMFRLTTNPAGAEASFDGDASSHCTSPCALMLPMGRHSLTVHHTGYRETQRIFTLPDETGLIVNLEAAVGSLNLVTNPSGLTVVIDGSQKDSKTPASFTLPVGTHHIEVLRGSEKQEFSVEIRDAVLTQKNISWN